VLPETAACRDCREKVEAYTTVGKRAVTRCYEPFWHEEPVWLILFVIVIILSTLLM